VLSCVGFSCLVQPGLVLFCLVFALSFLYFVLWPSFVLSFYFILVLVFALCLLFLPLTLGKMQIRCAFKIFVWISTLTLPITLLFLSRCMWLSDNTQPSPRGPVVYWMFRDKRADGTDMHVATSLVLSFALYIFCPYLRFCLFVLVACVAAVLFAFIPFFFVRLRLLFGFVFIFVSSPFVVSSLAMCRYSFNNKTVYYIFFIALSLDNWALLKAHALAKQYDVPLHVCFTVVPNYMTWSRR
jgi:hypothetical protein